MEYLRKVLGYDDGNEESIFSYAINLRDKSFRDVIKLYGENTEFASEAYSNKNRKGGLGNLIEEVYFGFKANSEQEADFPKVGIELKVTPYERNRDGSFRAGERLVITMIGFDKAVEQNFMNSHVWNKVKRMLLICYFRDKNQWNCNLDYPINFITIFTPPQVDLEIIKNDYYTIINKIKSGKAHELSEGDTQYLGACTKGSDSSKMVQQFYGDHTLAKTRAFCYKQSYMTFVLRYYIMAEAKDVETGCIIKDVSDLRDTTFVELLQERIGQYVGRNVGELAIEFGINMDNKSALASLSYKLLGVKGNKAEEFIKAGIELKTVRINKRGTINEHFRMTDIVFKKMANEEWEESDFYDYITSTSFLFVVFKEQDDGSYILNGSQLWHIPYSDLMIVEKGWTSVREKLRDGVTFTPTEQSDGTVIVKNDIPGTADNPIYHIRPHQSQTYYVLHNGTEYGRGGVKNTDELPDGQRMTKQSNWFRGDYILSQLREDLKK